MNAPKLSLMAAAMAGLMVASAQAADDKITFGGALCLTGVQAPLDTPGYKGAQVAIKALNDAGGVLGKPVEFVNIDGKSDPVTVGNAAVGPCRSGGPTASGRPRHCSSSGNRRPPARVRQTTRRRSAPVLRRYGPA